MNSGGCTCPTGQTGPVYVRDKDCPEHGLATLLGELDGMRLFKFDDGYQVLANSQAVADRVHERHRLRKS